MVLGEVLAVGKRDQLARLDVIAEGENVLRAAIQIAREQVNRLRMIAGDGGGDACSRQESVRRPRIYFAPTYGAGAANSSGRWPE